MEKSNGEYKILVVDDDQLQVKLIVDVLRKEGYYVGCEMDGSKALEILSGDHEYDLTLMNINIPGMTDALKKIKETDKQLPVILLKANGNADGVAQGFHQGVVDCISKPLNTTELLMRVHLQHELKQKKDELKAYSKELKEVNDTKKKVLSVISHDLRNPIGSLQIISKMLQSSIATDNKVKTDELLAWFDQTLNGCENLMDNLIEWAHSQAGRTKNNPREYFLGSIAEAEIEAILPWIRKKNIKIINEISDDQVAFVDERLLKIVLRNLLSNAVKYCYPNKGKVLLNARAESEMVYVTIQDNGVGIEPGNQKHLFRVNEDIVSSPGTDGEEGHGLGLILCNEFVSKMGGSIKAESEPGKGSTLIFSIPAK